MKLWGGRFSKSTDLLVDDFNSSIRFDARMYKCDIDGSMAHAEMLGRQGIIPKADAELIVKTLGEIKIDIENGNVEFLIDAEDIHMNIETILISRIGDVGKRLHTGRSRNDQVALDIRMYLRDELDELSALVSQMKTALLEISEANLDTIMPGYT
ncbi:MAG: lyase family protein, partial [Oscillospiraceae bacterium]